MVPTRMSIYRLTKLALLSVLLGAPLLATERFVLDPATSRVTFTLAATGHTVAGEMKVLEGAVEFEPTGGAASGRIVVDARSANTGNTGRDEKMHREVLETHKFPHFELEVAALQGTLAERGTSELVLEGTIALHGVRKPIRVPLEVVRSGDRLGAEGSFVVPYVAWGLKDPSVFVLRVAKEVTVQLDINGRLTVAPADLTSAPAEPEP